MAVAFIQEFKIQGDDRTTTNYDAGMKQLNLAGYPAAGLITHTAGWDEAGGVFRIFTVWETAEDAGRFMTDRLQPVLDQGPANPDNSPPPDHEAIYELHNIVKG